MSFENAKKAKPLSKEYAEALCARNPNGHVPVNVALSALNTSIADLEAAPEPVEEKNPCKEIDVGAMGEEADPEAKPKKGKKSKA